MLHRLLEMPWLFRLNNWVGRFTVAGYNRLLVGKVRLVRGALVLDIGCGIGQTRAMLKDQVYIGVDINADYLTAATRSGQNGSAYSAMDSSKLAFADATFDAVISIAVFHHLTDEQVVLTLKEATRVCKPGGKVHVIDVVFPLKRWNLMKFLILSADRGRFGRWPSAMEAVVRANFPQARIEFRHSPLHDLCYVELASAT